MNEPLFRNYYTRDEAAAKEIMKYSHFSGARGKVLIGGTVLAVIVTLCGLYADEPALTPIYFIPDVAYVLLWLTTVSSYFRSVKTLLQRDTEFYGEEPSIQTNVFDDRLELCDKIASREFSFSHVVSVFETKNYIILTTKGAQMFIFKKDGFILGDSDGFREFLRSKNIKIQK